MQSESTNWFEYRNDRITASNFFFAAKKVDANLQVINPGKSKTFLSNVCGYYPKVKSKATQWGLGNEALARKLYIKNSRKKHHNLHVSECGLFIDLEFPYIAASPDALVSCTCHEPGLLEIKCPWTHRGSTITQYATDKKSCLEMVNNEPRLKRTHMYWYQVQCQMHATKRKWYDFFLCTTKDSFLERVTYNEVFFAANVEKAKVVYEKLIVPEIFTRELKSNIQLEHDIRNVINEMLTQIVTDVM